MSDTTGSATGGQETQDHRNCGAGCMCGGNGPAFTKFVESMMPPGAGEHFKQAHVEFLKGLRSLIDARIQSLSHTATKGTTVNVD